MFKTRLAKIENKVLPKDPPFITCIQNYYDGTIEYGGKKYAGMAELKAAINGRSLVMVINYCDPNSPHPHPEILRDETELGKGV